MSTFMFAGVRQVETGFTTVGGYKPGPAPVTPLTVHKTYSSTLPSLSLKAEVTDLLLVRFGAARITRGQNISLRFCNRLRGSLRVDEVYVIT